MFQTLVKRSLPFVALFVLPNAFARPEMSEYYIQTPASTMIVEPHLGYHSSTISAPPAASVTTQGLSSTGLLYEYGINEMWAAAFDLSYASYKRNSVPNASAQNGLNDPRFLVAGKSDLGPGTLHYGSYASLGLGKMKLDAYGNAMNNAVGGSSLSPYVGYDLNMGSCWFGAQLLYAYNFNRSADLNGTDVTLKGGNATEFTLFYEHVLMPDTMLGGKFVYDSLANFSENIGGAGESSVEMGKLLQYGLYTRIPVASMQWALAEFDYHTHSGDKYLGQKVDSVKGFDFMLSYRMIF